jgi:hypothetical protein
MPSFAAGRLTAVICVAVLTLTACARGGRDEMRWARAALERNTAIDIVAADQQSRTFTVRVKASGELSIVRADQVIGSVPQAAGAAPAAPLSKGAMPPAATAPAASTEEAAPPASASVPPAAAAMPPAQQASLAPQSTPFQPAAAGAVLESGPGYSIKMAGAAPVTRARDTGITSAPLERRHEPIVCQGSYLLHIDNRNLRFDGDAVSAEDGCEIHITNSRISAAGVGVSARAANVHIDNSMIEGDQASIDASEGAQVYASDSRFKGLSRRLDNAAFHDLGGNIWN